MSFALIVLAAGVIGYLGGRVRADKFYVLRGHAAAGTATGTYLTDGLAELVCSNSFRSDDAENNAVGLLHAEMRRLGSLIMACGDATKLPAGGALAVDRVAFSQKVTEIPSHRILAIRRGEAEEELSWTIEAPVDDLVAGLRQRVTRGRAAVAQLTQVAEDAYRRLLAPSVEVELRLELKTRADEDAIGIFGSNLEQLLLGSPAGERVVLGLDPGYRTGVKAAVVSRTGAVLDTATREAVARALASAEFRYRAGDTLRLRGLGPWSQILVIGTAGNTGAQSATTITRAMAVGEVRLDDLPPVVLREVSTGLLLGATLALVASIPIGLLVEPEIGLIVGLTLLTACTIAALFGSALPLVAKRIGLDPAVVSVPLITALIDASGLLIYFLIAGVVLGP